MVLFWGCFSFKALDLGDFRGISKIKNVGKEEDVEGSRIFLGGGMEGRDLCIFFELFFWFLDEEEDNL